MSWDVYCARFVGCSSRSAALLSRLHVSGKVYTLYDWGGWLIWNYPEVKPSVDGRMTVWRDSHGYSAFERQYAFEVGWLSIDDSEYDVVYVSPRKPNFQRMAALVAQGRWAIAYADERSAIFVRVGPTASAGPERPKL
jgi:hypothetical protein